MFGEKLIDRYGVQYWVFTITTTSYPGGIETKYQVLHMGEQRRSIFNMVGYNRSLLEEAVDRVVDDVPDGITVMVPISYLPRDEFAISIDGKMTFITLSPEDHLAWSMEK